MTVFYRTPKIWMQPWTFGQALQADIQLTATDTLVWADMIYQDDLQAVIAHHGTPGTLISSAHNEQLVPNCNLIYWPHYLLKHSLILKANAENFDHLDVEYCANFMLNKKRIHRNILIKVLQWFGVTSFDYTWSGYDTNLDMQSIIAEFDNFPVDVIPDLSDFRSHLLSQIQNFEPRFFQLTPEHVLETNQADISDFCRTLPVWNRHLGAMVSKSAVSLITESLEHEKWATHTEKTLYAVHGLTFPIWVGGYGSAKCWKEKGFDIFDDVINHDYQFCDTLLERCVRAVADNLHILTDLSYARSVKLQHLDRLRKNRELLVPNFKQKYQDFWLTAPAEMKAEPAIKDEIDQLLILNSIEPIKNK